MSPVFRLSTNKSKYIMKTQEEYAREMWTGKQKVFIGAMTLII